MTNFLSTAIQSLKTAPALMEAVKDLDDSAQMQDQDEEKAEKEEEYVDEETVEENEENEQEYDEEDLIDPQEVLRTKCEEADCTELREIYEECNDRVNAKSRTRETCEQELIDLFHCIDHCVTKTLFKQLK